MTEHQTAPAGTAPTETAAAETGTAAPGLRITHTPAEGTLLEGTARGDGVNRVLRAAPMQWKWSPTLHQFYVQRSRDRVVPDRHGIDATATALRAAGHTVTVEIDVEIGAPTRTVQEREADREDRTDRRVDMLAARSERRAGEAAAARQARDRITEHIPFGQPILLGHHSQRRSERDAERIHNLTGRAVHADEAAREATRQAGEAAAGQRHRDALPVTLRRIEKLEAEERGYRRILDGYERPSYDGRGQVLYANRHDPATGQYRVDTQARLDDVLAQLEHWRGHVARLQAEGQKVWSRADFAKGDWVRMRDGWGQVVRVNPRSVSVPHPMGLDCTWKITYDKVLDRKSPAEFEALRHATMTNRPPDEPGTDRA
ncbi:DUF3560 domain-containing protein [Pseudonocardia sp. KRD291]|uniref:DUF3560 domain-containing protein n=1 Tax=Pseudonocardia sp. KRD291 TaxID=2792007 RepID=UPI001C49DFFA|nr:DUF3560 domain-containing protein [Pseudonocardia sp. KRD291]MBW0101518.1 DUF3560 domain-containing protein [Pseudonocardia sp. KRD291]